MNESPGTHKWSAKGGLCLVLAAIMVTHACGEDSGGARIALASDTAAMAIQLNHQGTIADSAVPGAFLSFAYVTRDAQGQFYVASMSVPAIMVFDSTGRHRQTLGGRGAGPGEYQMPAPPRFGPGDSIHVFDMRLRRATVLSPEGEYARSFNTPDFVGGRVVVLDNGAFVLAEDVRTPSRVGFPLHVVSRHGELGTAFGAETPQYRPDIPALTARMIAHAAGGQVWSARTTSYVIERWNPETGRMTALIERKVPWFRPYLAEHGSHRAVRPQPDLIALWEDDRQRLWVLIRVADANWEPSVHPDTAAAQAARHDPAARLTLDVIDQLYDWVIEVLDVPSGKLVARKRLSTMVLAGGGNDGALIATRSSEDRMATRYDLWEPRLVPVSRDSTRR